MLWRGAHEFFCAELPDGGSVLMGCDPMGQGSLTGPRGVAVAA
jgi:hypothetical protein